MLITLSIISVILLVIVVFLVIRVFYLIDEITKYEDAHEEYDAFFEKAKRLLEVLHNELEKISGYPTATCDPIVQKLTKLVSNSRDNMYNLIELIDSSGDQNGKQK